jgi:Arylsulfotransferase (ASST)
VSILLDEIKVAGHAISRMAFMLEVVCRMSKMNGRFVAGCICLFFSAGFLASCSKDSVDEIAQTDDAILVESSAEEPITVGDYSEEIEQMNSLGYLAGTEEPSREEGVTIYKKGAIEPAYNFYVSGPVPQAILMDMDGEILHRWNYPQKKLYAFLNPDTELEKKLYQIMGMSWRRAYLYPNGDILAIVDHYALLKLDKDSNLLWARKGGFHHDVRVGDDGRIFVLSNERKIIPAVNSQNEVNGDLIIVLDEGGAELERISIYSAFVNFNGGTASDMVPSKGDLFHTNTLKILDGSLEHLNPAFQKGNILVSLLMLSTVGIVDPNEGKMIWMFNSDFRFQHEPSLLPNGNLLVFDNFGPSMRDLNLSLNPTQKQNLWYGYVFNPKLPVVKRSAVVEYDVVSGEEVWRYEGSPENPFYSQTCGSTYRLPNGNTLINETQHGRSFEVSPSGKILWEYDSPHRTYMEKVSSLFDLQRVSIEEVDSWLGK